MDEAVHTSEVAPISSPFLGFSGSFPHMLDGKKRLTIPAKWLKFIGSQDLQVLRGMQGERCLYAFRAEEWMARMAKANLQESRFIDKQIREAQRKLGFHSECVTPDARGCIRIRDSLLAFAGIIDPAQPDSKEWSVLLVGTLTWFELWNPEQYQLACGSREEPSEDESYVKALDFLKF